MSNVADHVTPLTRGIIWLAKGDLSAAAPVYRELDYLLDGLLTANLAASAGFSSVVVVGQSFARPLYVAVIRELRSREIESYLSLFKNDLGPENEILVLDDAGQFAQLRSELKPLTAHLKLLQ
jgi:hypothetical protein